MPQISILPIKLYFTLKNLFFLGRDGIAPTTSGFSGKRSTNWAIYKLKMDPVGVEPTFSTWKVDVLPLDEENKFYLYSNFLIFFQKNI